MRRSSSSEPTRRLPEKPSLTQLKKQAKDLLRAYRAGDATVANEVTRFEPDAAAAAFALHDAQRVLARAYGFPSWSKLKHHVDGIDVAAMERAVKARDVRRVRKLVRERPELVHMDRSGNDEHRPLHHAVLSGDAELTRLLMEHGADARQGIHPHRDATSAHTLATERGYADIVAIIEAEERHRRDAMSCPNVELKPEQDRLHRWIHEGRADKAMAMMSEDPGLIRACDRSGASPMHAAATTMNVALVNWLAGRRADARRPDAGGWTPIDRAVLGVGWRSRNKAKHIPAVADVLRRRGCEITPLAAAALGDLDALRRFGDDEPKRLTEGYHWNLGGLLSAAVTFGRLDALRWLLDFGLDPNERIRLAELEEDAFSEGRPLWLAAAFGEHVMAELLLERGADPNANVYASGWPIDRAYDANDSAMCDLLVRHGAVLRATTIGLNRDVVGARTLLAGGPREVIEDVTSYDCRTVAEELLWAGACGGSPEIVSLCLPRIDRALDNPWWHGILDQPLRIWNHGPHRPRVHHDRSTYPKCLKLLLDHGADPNATRRFGQRLLHDVAALGVVWGKPVLRTRERLEFARLLLDAGARLDVRDDILESTPLGWACRWRRAELVDLLLERGAAANEPEAKPWATPLAWAQKSGHRAIARRLRKAGAET